MNKRLARILLAAVTLPAAACGAHADNAAPPAQPQSTAVHAPAGTPLPRSAFGMHYLGYGSHAYPGGLGFGSARIWDMGVTWPDLQPAASSWNTTGLARLDGIVSGFARRHVSAVLVLGMTPAWAARPCPHGSFPATTCAPRATDANSPWAAYVRLLVTRYDGRHGHPKVTYFETWNEPNLRNGWNDSISQMAALQATAYTIVHGHGAGQQLLSPSWATSFGSGATSLAWLDTFLAQPGGRSFDVTNLHVYPTVPASKADDGPEWSINRLADVRAVLVRHGVGNRPVWNTETNIGSPYPGAAGAGELARTFVLATQNHVARTFWYAADNRSWGGVFLENADYASLTPAGVAYRWIADVLTGARPYGCSSDGARYSCAYQLANGTHLLAVWTTGPSYAYDPPSGTSRWYDVTGAPHKATGATRLRVSHTPIYVVGSFPI